MPTVTINKELFTKPCLRTNNGKALWFVLLSRINNEAIVDDSFSELANRIGVSEKTVRNLLKEFVADGLILIKSPNDCPKKVRMLKHYILLCQTAVCGDKKTSEVRKKSEPKSERLAAINSSSTLNNKPCEYDFVDPNFAEAFLTWIKYKSDELNQKYKTERTLRAVYKKLIELSHNNPDTAIKIVEQSMAFKWKGLFKLQNDEPRTNTTNNERAASRSRLQSLASAIISKSPAIANLYDGLVSESNARQD